jgi:predicted pyridoxine 5'-phosphate oxidase superfamily flavin-nucleotide-binding protein
MLNVTENPQVGLLFLVPGIDESLRVNGRARFTTDADLLAPLAVQGRPPVAGLIVTVEEVYFHCGKALMRSRLWDPDTRVERASFPSLGRILADQIAGSDVRESERFIEESYRTRLY